MAISTGTLTTTGSTTYIVGTSSGLDTSALIDTAVAAETASADLIEVNIDENTAKIAAYAELQGLIEDFQSSLETLSSTFGFSTESDSVFDARTGYMESNGSTDATSLLSVAVEDGSALGDYEIVVQQKATAMKVTGGAEASSSDALGYAGIFSIGLEDGTSVDIEVTNDMSLSDVAAAINAEAGTSGVSAVIVQVAEDSYTLVITGDQTAKALEITSVSGDDVMTNLGVTDGLGDFSNVTQDPQEAIIVLDGLTITRDDNEFDDVLDGISFTVEGADEDTTISLSIQNDTETTKEDIQAFIDAYNAVRTVIVSNQTVSDDGTLSEDAVLFGDSLLKQINSDIAEVLSDTTLSDLSTLRDIGIEYTDDNYLIIVDETALDDALLNEFDSVRDLFSSSVTLNSDDFTVLRNDTTLVSGDLTLDVTVDGDGAISSVSVDGNTSLFTISGTRITGADGTAYEGLSLSFSGDTSQTLVLTMNQGLANRMSNVLDDYVNESTGLLVVEQTELESTNEDLEEEVSEIESSAARLQEQLIEKYAAMETKLALLEILSQQIAAILGSDDD